MPMFMLLALPFAIVAAPSGHDGPALGRPVDEGTLAAVRGGALPTTRLSLFVQQQGATQGQFVGEDMRSGLANWFADANVQAIANAALRGG